MTALLTELKAARDRDRQAQGSVRNLGAMAAWSEAISIAERHLAPDPNAWVSSDPRGLTDEHLLADLLSYDDGYGGRGLRPIADQIEIVNRWGRSPRGRELGQRLVFPVGGAGSPATTPATASMSIPVRIALILTAFVVAFAAGVVGGWIWVQ